MKAAKVRSSCDRFSKASPLIGSVLSLEIRGYFVISNDSCRTLKLGQVISPKSC